jgi:PAS domain S-box-containing protein
VSACVLIVEGNPIEAARLQGIVQGAGYQAIWAQDGVAARAAIATCPPDLAIVDSSLPAGEGYTLCRAVREANPGCRAILMVSLSTTEHLLCALEAGADGYLPRLSGERALLDKVAALLARRTPGSVPDEGELAFEHEGRSLAVAASREQILNLMLAACKLASLQRQELERLKAGLERERAAHDAALREVAGAMPGFVYQFVLRPDGSFGCPYVSDGIARLLGVEAVEVLADPDRALDLVLEEDMPSIRAVMARSAQTMEPSDLECRVCRPGGDTIWLHSTLTPHALPDGSMLWNGIAMDVTGYHQAQDALRESEARFRAIYEHATVGLYRTTPDGYILMANPALVRMLGYGSFAELAERDLEQQGYEPFYERAAFRERIEREGQLSGLESAWLRRDGSVLYVRESARAVRDASGQTLYYEGTVEDLTAVKQVEDRLRVALAEKETLLHEVHHRIKNNLQVISSLLDLQAEAVGHGRVREAFRESRNRVRSIAHLHEQLYRSRSTSQVEMGPYIRSLWEQLCNVYGIVAVDLDLDVALNLDTDTAIALGLIVNELVSNVFKYAFPPGAPGRGEESDRVRIVLRPQGRNRTAFLAVTDNGVGMPSDVDPGKAATLGLTLVDILTRQLGGQLEMTTDARGTSFRIAFPLRRVSEPLQPVGAAR